METIKRLQKIVPIIVDWYQKEGRELPWRENKNPYTIWISEIMLQQTKIEAVKKYYQRFMKELPDIQALAEVEEEKLLKLWQGLGYYNRARNLKKAAMCIIEQYQGIMPNNYQELCKLSGIGEYTAGAIASIAYQEKTPAVDGNVLRVVSRMIGSKKDVLLPETKKEITEILTQVMPNEAGDFNEGLMELGEIICIPNGQPLCDKCPVNKECRAYQENLTLEIPVRIKKTKRKKEERTIILLITQDKIAIQKRGEKGLLANMYQFPNREGKLKKDEIQKLLDKWKLSYNSIEEVGSYTHIFSHIEWHMKGYKIEVKNENETFLWVTKRELETNYPVPTAFRFFVNKWE